MDHIHGGDIRARKPPPVHVEALDDAIVVKILSLIRLHCGTDTVAGSLVAPAVEAHKKQLRQVCTRTEELHIPTDAHRGDTARYGIIIAESLAHQVIALVLYRIGVAGNLSSVTLEGTRKRL